MAQRKKIYQAVIHTLVSRIMRFVDKNKNMGYHWTCTLTSL